jgi:ELWxxDGT repeat protein
LYFQAYDSTNGYELWKIGSDGSPTRINLGSGGSSPSNLLNANGTLYFVSGNSYSGTTYVGPGQLWKIDSAGTPSLIQVGSVGNSAYVSNLTLVGSNLFFQASDGTNGYELWKVDAAGAAALVKDIRVGGNSSSPSNLYNVNSTLYFTADNGISGVELWKSDGTAAGTVLAKDINGRTLSSSPDSLIDVAGTLYFRADNGVNGQELWKIDRTTGSPVQLEINAGAAPSYVNYLTNVNGTLYFQAYDSTNGYELWKIGSDGSPTRINLGSGGSSPSNLLNANGTLYFVSGNSYSGTTYVGPGQLWKIDSAGTPSLIQVGSVGNSAYVSNLTLVGSNLFFQAYDGTNGYELWKVDAAGAAALVKDIRVGGNSSNPSNLYNVNDTLYFTANDGVNGTELWKSNGTASGTVQLEINPGVANTNVSNLVSSGGVLYFTAANTANGQELWRINSTTGVPEVLDINTGTNASSPNYLTDVNGTLYFQAYNPTNGSELWRVVGATGTLTLIDLYNGNGSSNPNYLVNISGTLYFTASGYNGTSFTGNELWKIDPATGNANVIELVTGSGLGSPSNLTNVNGNLYFTAYQNGATNTGLELWKLDAVTGNPVFLKDINVGSTGSDPGNLTYSNGKLYFTADNGTEGRELWAYDIATVIVVGNVPKTGAEDQPIGFTANDFSSVFSSSNGALTKIQVVALPSNGSLKLNNVNVTANQEISLADLGNLTFTPNLNYNGIAGFTWNGFDGIVYATNPATVSITVSPVNDAPELVNRIQDVSFYSNTSTNFFIPGNAFRDVDLDNLTYTATLADGSPLPSWLTLNGTNFGGIPPIANIGQSIEIKVTATDPSNTFATDNFLLNILSSAPTNLFFSSGSGTVPENSANGTLVGTLSSSDPSPSDTFTYTLLNDAGGRFAISGNQVVVANGTLLDFETAQQHTVRIRTTDSTNLSYERDVTINVSNVNDTSPGTLSFTGATYSVNENGTPIAAVTIQRIDGAEGFVRVSVALSNGTATFPADYSTNLTYVDFVNGETSKTVNIPVFNDNVTELSETINLTLVDPQGGATLGTQTTAVLTIVDDDLLLPGVLSFASNSYSVNENGIPSVTVLRTGGSNGAVTVSIVPTNGTAIAPADFNNAAIAVSFADGETSKTVALNSLINDDTSYEQTENLTLTLSTPTGGATIGSQATSTLNIIDNDAAPGVVQFSAATYSVNEDGTTAAAITLVRSGGSDGAVSVRVDLSNGSAIAPNDYFNNPIVVSFTNGESSKTVTIPISDDAVIEPTETINLSLSDPAGGVTIGAQRTTVLSIVDNDVKPTLTVEIAAQTNENNGAISGTVTRNTGLGSDLVVNLLNSDSGQISVPATVTILAGQTAANFNIGIVNDTLIEANKSYSITGAATGFVSAVDTFQIIDDDAVNLTVALNSNSISENGGKTIVTVTRDVVTDTALIVQLTGDTNVTLPGQVTIAANQATATFEVDAVDDALLNGNRTVAIMAKPTYTGTTVVTPTGNGTASLTVVDDETASLKLSINRDIIAEGATANVTVTRNSDTTNDLVVNLVSSDNSQATTPNTVTILAGQTTATFAVTGVNDGVNDGSKSVTLTASATGLNSGTDVLEITDVNIPDLFVKQLSGVQPVYTSKQSQFTYEIINNGISVANGAWKDKVYLSKDNKLDAQDTLLGEFGTGSATTPANLLPGLSYSRTVTYFTPRTPGEYYLIATTDSGNNVAEGTGIAENNNTSIAPLTVTAAYRGVVSTAVNNAVAGTTITLNGQALSNINNAPVPYEFVTIAVKNQANGTVREISAFTNGSGDFVSSFTPLPNEGGQYEINAYFPGNKTEDAAPEDTFKILGMQFTSAGVAQKVISDSTFSGTLSLKNLTDIPLTGITATVLGAPADWNVQVTAPTTLAGDATNSIGYTITAPNSSTTTFDKFGIQLTSSEGTTTTIPLDITLERTIPRLVASPTALTSGMLRGGQTFVNFEITNEGGAATGDIDVLTPSNTPWLKLTSPGKISSLAPGQSTTLTALLTPDASLSLTQYQGSLFFDVAGNDGDLSLPFNFRAVSTATGNVRVDVSDELTYFQAGAPHLQGAKVVLRDYFTNEIVRETVTDSTGLVDWADVAEGPYKLEVTADKHDTYRQTIQIDAGESENINSFLSRQTVRYTWNVTPTEIEDKYIIKIESTFETNVPVPTVTVDPPSIDFGELQSIGQIMQIEMTVTNHGLIAADNVNLGFGTHPFYKIEPLIDSIDLLSAKSSVTVPVRITRIADFDPVSNSELSTQAAANVPCQISAGMSYSYECAGVEIKRSIPIPIFNVEGNCFPPVIGSPGFYGYGTGPGGGYSGPSGGYVTPIDIVSTPSNCDPCVQKTLQAISNCVIKFIPLPDWAKCGKDVFGTLTADSGLEAGYKAGKSIISCAKAVGKTIPGPWKYLKVLECTVEILGACVGGGSGGGGNGGSGGGGGFSGGGGDFGGGGATGSFSSSTPGLITSGVSQAAIDLLKNNADSLQKFVTAQTVIFGDIIWWKAAELNNEKFTNWLEKFEIAIDGINSADRKISVAERSILLTTEAPEGITGSDINKFLDRWNRSIDYWEAGILNQNDLPANGNSDFLAIDTWKNALAASNAEVDKAKAAGYDDLGQQTLAAVGELKKSLEGTGGVCAKVKISIDQEAVMTRSAFLGSLEISNGNETSLNNISVALEVKDQNGIIVNDLFGITQPILVGISAVDGTGILTGNNPTTPIDEGFGSAKWTFIPTNLAAPEVPTQYTIGGKLSYTENGKQVTVPLIAAPITVLPQAELYLDYFQQRNVYADDPFTDDIVETSVPFALGVLVRNEGKGDAKNLRITSSQPKIVENKKGLLVDFEIIGSEVNGTGVSPSLAVNFGDIAAGKTAVADWQLKSSIQGKFTDYKATFEHVNGLGKKELSLIKDVKIHELIHQVKADRPTGDDTLPDFLVNEVFDANFTPDTIYFSNGGTATVAFAAGTADAPITVSDRVAQITATTTPGWSYIKLTDPGDGKYKVKNVVRSDGKVIKTDNVWLTDRTFPGTGRPTYENILHLVDFDSTGSYTITYSSGDTISPTADIIDVSPDPRTTAVGSIDVTFSEAIQGSTFNYQDLSLTLNGGANLITSATTVALVSDTTYRITGLDTSGDGQYLLSLATSGITDLDGNAGTTTATETWTKAVNAPTILAINGIANPLRNSAVNSLEVAFSQTINPSTLDISDFSLTLNGGANLLTASNTITSLSGSTYSIGNIQGITGNAGNYVFSVNASGVQNLAGNTGIGNRTVNWQLDNIQPTLQSISGVSVSSRRQPVQQVEVTFSEAIDITTLSASDITLNRNGVAVTLSGLDITSAGNGKYLVKGLAAAQNGDGNYQLIINGGSVSDLAGNAGTGTATVNWSIDTVAPTAATDITISPNTGISNTDLLTNSLALTINGTIGELGTQVSLKDLTTNIDLGTATVTGNNFSQNIVLNNSGTHQIQVHIVDVAGNFTNSSINVFVDQAAPTSRFGNTPAPSATGINSIDIAFSEAINSSSFTLADLNLTRDGVVVSLSGASITPIVGTDNYQLSGLSALTAIPGSYILSLNNAGVIDRAGNAGANSTLASFTVTAPAAPGIQIIQSGGSTTVNEGGANDTYGVVLNTQPTSDVVVTISANNQLTTNKQTLTFTASNWNIAQDVTIAAVDDILTQGDRSTSITHSSTSTDSNYASVTIPALNVTIRDNDAEIRGLLWEDFNGNGQKDGAESNLANRTVYLDSNNNGSFDVAERTTTTNINGAYAFNDLRAGSYTVAQILPTGWSQTYPIINVSTSASNAALYVPTEAALSSSVTGVSATSVTLTNLQSFQADARFANIKGQGYSTVIIDTGADLDSSYFGADANGDGVADRIIYQNDFADRDNDASDRTGHGSHVASIAAQLAPDANLIILKVFKDSGTGSFADLEKALQWVNQNTATYNIASVNLSLGDSQNWNTSNPRYGIGDEIAAISAQNVIIAAAAGNNFYRFNGAPGVAYPAADPNTIAVGAVWAGNFGGTQSFSSGAKDYATDIDRIASFSQRDTNLLDVFAPGVFISGANANGGTQSLGGTSQATPFVAGIAVLAQQIALEKLGRKLTVAEFRQLLDSTSTIIKDGDDENDNVVNTGASYPRIDLLNLAQGVANFSGSSTTGGGSNPNVNGGGSPTISGSQILTHLVTVNAGQIVTDKNFGSRQDLNQAKNDFSGDNKSDILWRNDDGRVVIWRMDGSTVLSDTFIERPAPLDWQIAGTADFNGDNKSDILWRNKDGRVVIWRMDGSTVLSDTFIERPALLDWQIAGTADFNGDNKSDILWRNKDGRVVIWRMDGSTVLSDTFIERPAPLDWQIAGIGDFNGDNESDILWRNKDGRVVIWRMDGSTVLSDSFIDRPAPLDWRIAETGDFNGDNKSDILWRNADGRVVIWQMDGSTVLSDSFIDRPSPLDWNIAGTGDFNSDNKSDILWRNNDGRVVTWQMDGSTVLSDSFIERPATLDWKIEISNINPIVNSFPTVTNDFGKDYKSDILWRNEDGRVVIWEMDGSTVLSDSFIERPSPLDWNIAGTGDFNGDNKSDILWRHDNGRVVIWQMDGSSVLSDSFIKRPAPLDWNIAGTGDFNGDHKSDILWRNTDGRLAIWQMDGSTVISDSFTTTAATNDWQIAGTGDFNGDNKSDILWRNADGQVVIWQMDGSSVLSDSAVRAVDNDWLIQGVDDFNGDGKSDILWRNTNTDAIYIYQMDGASVATEGEIGMVSNDRNISGTGDYNGDSKADILWRDSNGLTSVWTMNGLDQLGDKDIRQVNNSWKIVASI